LSSNQGGALCARCSSIHHLFEYFQRESLSLKTIVLWPILYRTRANLFLSLSIFLSCLNVGSRSSPIMILENRIRLIEIQLRCQTLFNSPKNKLGKGRRRTNSGATLFAAWRRLLRNYATVINPATISDVNRVASRDLQQRITDDALRTAWHIEFYALRVIYSLSRGERRKCEYITDETRREVSNLYPFVINIRSAANTHLWKNVIWI